MNLNSQGRSAGSFVFSPMVVKQNTIAKPTTTSAIKENIANFDVEAILLVHISLTLILWMFFEIPETNRRNLQFIECIHSNVVPRTDQNKYDVYSTFRKWLLLTYGTRSTFSDLNSLFLFMSCFQASFPNSSEKSPMANHGAFALPRAK